MGGRSFGLFQTHKGARRHLFISKRASGGDSESERLDQSFLLSHPPSLPLGPFFLFPPPSRTRCSPWQRDVALQNRTRTYVTAKPANGERSARKRRRGRGFGADVGSSSRSAESALTRARCHTERAATGNKSPVLLHTYSQKHEHFFYEISCFSWDKHLIKWHDFNVLLPVSSVMCLKFIAELSLFFV